MSGEALRTLDAEIHAAFADAGFAATGFYTAPGANFDVPVDLYLDRGVQSRGEFGQVVSRRDEMRILQGDGIALKPAGRILIESTPGAGSGEVWELVEKIGDDGSLSHWVVRRV